METKYYFDCQCSSEPYLKAENFANTLAEKRHLYHSYNFLHTK